MPARDVVIRLRGDFSQFRKQVAAAEANVKGFTKELEKSSAKRSAFTELGGTFGKVGLAAGLAGAVAVRAFANFDQAMSAVAATGKDARDSIDQLRQAAIDAGARTTYSATEAAQAVETLAKAGVSAADTLGGGLDGALDLAAAGSLDVAEAAEYASVAMTQFGLSGRDVPHIADLLAAGAGKANGEVSDLGMALKQAGLVANQTGLTIEETTAGLSAFAAAGLLGSDAGTSFKATLQRLTPQSAEAKKEMERLGITAYDAQGNFIGLSEFAGNLQSGLKNLTVEQRNSSLATIFGSDAVRAASVLYEEGAAGIEKWEEKTNDAGYAADTARIKLNNFKGDLEQLRGAFETALIGTGEGANGPLRQITQSLTDIVNAYNKLPGPIKDATAAMLGITAVLGGGLWFTTKTIAGVAAMRANMTALSFSARGAAGAMASVAKSAGLIGAAYVAFDSGSDIINSLKRTTGAAGETSASFDKLVKNLEKSNVGKYASTFGIDIQKLAEDIARFGDKGEYYQQVMATMDAANDGFGGTVKRTTDFLTPWIGSTEKAAIASMDLGRILDKTKVGMEITATATDDVDQAAAQLAGTLQDTGTQAAGLTQEMQEQQEANRTVATQFGDVGAAAEKSKGSISSFTSTLRDQAKALRDFRKNAGEAAKKGLDEGLIASLQQLGPEGASILKGFAEGSKTEIGKANKAWRDLQKEQDRYIKKPIPTKSIKVNNAQALAAIRAVLLAIGDVGGAAAITLAARIVTNRAEGGHIAGPGTGTSDSVPAMLSNGEHVLTASDVQKMGGQGSVYRLRAAAQAGVLPKFAKGGAVGLDELRAMESIKDLEKELAEKVKKGKRRGQYVLKAGSLARRIAIAELREARQELADLKSNQDERDSVSSDLTSGFSLGDFAGKDQYGFTKKVTSGQIVAGAAAFAAKIKAFAGKLDQAARLGLPPVMLQEIAGLGVEEGTQVVDALIAAPPGDIASIKASYASIGAYGAKAGGTVAGAMSAGASVTQAYTSSSSGAGRGALIDYDLLAQANARQKATLLLNGRQAGEIVRIGRQVLKEDR